MSVCVEGGCIFFLLRPTGFLSLYWNIRAGARCLELIKKDIMLSAHLQPLCAYTSTVNSLSADFSFAFHHFSLRSYTVIFCRVVRYSLRTALCLPQRRSSEVLSSWTLLQQKCTRVNRINGGDGINGNLSIVTEYRDELLAKEALINRTRATSLLYEILKSVKLLNRVLLT